MISEHQSQPRRRWSPTTIIAFLGFAAVAAFYLWTEHRAHLLGALPYLIFLICPLMHFFMHRGHGHGGHNGAEKPAGHDHQSTQGGG